MTDRLYPGLLCVVVMLVAACTHPPRRPAPAREDCRPAPEQVRWIQAFLDGWSLARREFLGRDEAPLPWIVLFDTSCVWNVAADESLAAPNARTMASVDFAGNTIPVLAVPHGGAVELPNGNSIPPEPIASAFLYRDGAAPFFVLSMPEVWRTMDWARADPRLENFLLGVATHEMVHTLQLVEVKRRVAELAESHELPEHLNDDIIQDRFADAPGFREAYEAELELFREAARVDDDGARRDLVARALALVGERRARYFSGPDAFYATLEDLFLNMEGVAVWTHAKLAGIDPGVAFDTEGDPFWSQDEGFALFLLIERMVPGWQPRVLGPELASPFALLEEAL